MADIEPSKNVDDPFAAILGSGGERSTENAPADDPFRAVLGGAPSVDPLSSASGAFARGAVRGVVPAAGGLAGAGAGAAAVAAVGAKWGAAAGALVPGLGETGVSEVVGAGVGAFAGGLIGGFGGSYVADRAQDVALHKLPDSWVESIGQDDRQQRLDQEQHPYASFAGGLAPFAVTMGIGGAPAASTANMTTWERVLKSPITARVFSGALMGGMELGQEAAEGDVDWNKVAISTGFGVVFNHPNKFGQAIEGVIPRVTGTRDAAQIMEDVGARREASRLKDLRRDLGVPYDQPPAPVPDDRLSQGMEPNADIYGEQYRGYDDWHDAISNRYFEPPYNLAGVDFGGHDIDISGYLRRAPRARGEQPEPTLLNAWSLGTAGPGRTEKTHQGTEATPPAIEQAAQQAQRDEDAVLGKPLPVDVNATARAAEPEAFADMEALRQQRDILAAAAAEPGNETAKTHLAKVEQDLAAAADVVAAARRRAAEKLGEPVIETPAPGPAKIGGDDYDAIVKAAKKQLLAAGRSDEEAEQIAHAAATHVSARSEQFEGKLGTPLELYNREGATFRGEGGKTTRVGGTKSPEPPAPKPAPVAASPATDLWNGFLAARKEPSKAGQIETGHNPDTTRAGAPLRKKASQSWSPGDVVDVGFVKDLLVTGVPYEGEHVLVGKPDAAGKSRAYSYKAHDGLKALDEPVDFAKIAASIAKAREDAKAAPPKTAELPPSPTEKNKGRRKIGVNGEGNAIWEDERGVRSIVTDGVRESESVRMKPGGGIEVSRAPGSRFDPVEPAPAPAPPPEAPAEVPPAELRAEPAASPPEKAAYGASNKLFTPERAAAARERLKQKLREGSSTLSAGIDPEFLQLGTELAGYHLEAGARSFAAFAKAIAADLETKLADLRPYLRSWYNGARDMMEDHGFDVAGMDPADKVNAELARALAEEANGSNEPVGNQSDQQGIPGATGERPDDSQHADGRADKGGLEGGQPEDVGAAGKGGDDGKAGVRGAATDVGGKGPAGEVGDAGDGRAGDGRKGASDDGTGEPQRGPVTPEETLEVSPGRLNVGDFHLDNPLEIVGGGAVKRFDRNMDAIKLFNALRDEGRPATKAEQRTLAGYTGWGSFGQELFQGTWDRPAPKAEWKERSEWLRGHLGQDEWESAQRSITNAHYTDPPTVMAMWDMVRRLGFGGGRVLEPSMGIGNFFGMMPLDLKERSHLAGIEMDQLTGGMAQLLYPKANIKIMPYQDSRTPDNFHDVSIGNWPFENTVIADRRYNKLQPLLHDYFFLKTIDQTRPGGLVVGITSNGTMDKKASRIRYALAKKAELVAAIRLPTGAFKEFAGTSVVTDIVILKKRPVELALAPDDTNWLKSVEVDTPSGNKVWINEYFASNPNNVLGTTDFGSGMTRGRAGMIVTRPENMAERLKDAVSLVPENIYEADPVAEKISFITNHTSDREGSLTTQDGKLYVVRGEHLAPAHEVDKYAVKDAKKTAVREAQLSHLIDMRKKYGALIQAERTGQDAEAARAALKESFDAFGRDHGPIGDSFGLSYLDKIDDPFYPALASLEINGKPAAILTRSTMRGEANFENPSVIDSFVLARNKSILPSLDDVAAIAKEPKERVKAELVKSGAVFETPTGDIIPSDIYLSGNVREKLRQAQVAAEQNPAMEHNVEALKAVQPPDVPYFSIEAQLGATWVPPATYRDFVAHMLNTDGKGVEAEFRNGRWKVKLPNGANDAVEARTNFGTEEMPFSKVVNYAFGNQLAKIVREDSDGTKYVDQKATDEVNARIAKIRESFGEWLWSDPERRVALEKEYNEVTNSVSEPKFDGSFLTFPGMALQFGNSPFDLRQHQRNAIWRGLVNRRSINAHEVGTGKTFTMAGIAVESRRYGIAKKPMILAHNANSKSVAAEAQQMYPAAKVLYIDNLAPDTINVKMRQIANDDWDAIVIPHSVIDRMSFREETLMNMAREQIAALEEEAQEAAKEDGHGALTPEQMDDDEFMKTVRSPTAKDLVRARNAIINKIKAQAQRSSREGAVTFEDLGVDMLLVDEAHVFKKPPIATRMRIKGLNTTTSGRSIQLKFMTDYIRANNAGGNVHTFTGTPITNTLTEIFHQMRYVMEDEMKQAGVNDWDGWFASFARELNDVELNAAGEYEAVSRLAAFLNAPELRRMVGQYMDTVFANDMPEMAPRETKDGKTLASPDLTEADRAELLNGRTERAINRPYKKVVNITSDMTPAQSSAFRDIQEYANSWRNMTGMERKKAMSEGAPESPIIHEGLANKASFDVRQLRGEELAGQEGKAFDEPASKLSRLIENVKQIYESDPLANQVIFASQGFSNSVSRSMGRNEAGDKLRRTLKVFSPIKDLLERLAQEGIPKDKVALVTGETSKDERKEIADKMNTGELRVVIGNTDTLGVGVNMQRNLRAMHHLDAPYMPGDLEQRNGRGHRQGNQWNTVLEYRYMTDRLDGRRWQILARKEKFIKDFLKGDASQRVIEGDVASDAEGDSDILQSFSQAAGDPRVLIREKMKATIERLQRSERQHTNGIADALRQVRNGNRGRLDIASKLADIEARGSAEKTKKLLADNAGDNFRAELQGKQFAKRADFDDAYKTYVANNMHIGDPAHVIGKFGEYELTAEWPAHAQNPVLGISVNGEPFGTQGGIGGIEGAMRRFPDRIAGLQADDRELETSVQRLQQVAATPFGRAKDLETARQRLDDLEKDIVANPVPPPSWLRQGAPTETDVYWRGKKFEVTGHRWTDDGYYVVGSDGVGEVNIPYDQAKDHQGVNLYEDHEFVPPKVVTKAPGTPGAAPAPAPDQASPKTAERSAAFVEPENIEELREAYADTRSELNQAQSNLEYETERHAQGHITDHELDTARALVDKLEKALDRQFDEIHDQRVLLQERGGVAMGKISLPTGKRLRSIITLFRTADATTAVHELGHDWLERLKQDAAHALAPEQLKADWETVKRWAGIGEDGKISDASHERFANGLVRYFWEGVAPSQAIARVFEKFRGWMRAIYKSMDDLPSANGHNIPLTPEMREVYGRLLTVKKRVTIAPHEEPPAALHNIHTGEAENVPAEHAQGAADRIEAERPHFDDPQPPTEIANEIAQAVQEVEAESVGPRPTTDAAGEAGSGDGGRGKVGEGGGEAGAEPGGGGMGAAGGEVGAGGNEPAGQGGGSAGGSASAGRSKPSEPVGNGIASIPVHLIGDGESPFVDKAGNFKRANINVPDDVWAAIKARAAANNDFIGDRRGVVTWDQTRALAQAMGKAGAEDLVDRHVRGQAFNAEQITALKDFLEDQSNEVGRLARLNDKSPEGVIAFATEQARLDMVLKTIMGGTAEAGRTLNIFRMMQKDADLNALMLAATGRTLFQKMYEMRMMSAYTTPESIAYLTQATSKHSYGRMVLEYWINGLISGPATHTTYVIGNMLLSAAKMGLETPVAAILSARRGPGAVVHMGEAAARLRGLASGLAPAVKAAGEAASTGLTGRLPGQDALKSLPFQPENARPIAGPMLDEAAKWDDARAAWTGAARGVFDGILSIGKLLDAAPAGSGRAEALYSPMGAIPDVRVGGAVLPTGQVARLPSRAVGVIHTFFRALNYSMEKNALTFRQAMNEGVRGDALADRVAQLRLNPSDEIMTAATTGATDMTLMGPGGELVRRVSYLTNWAPHLPGLGETPIFKFVDPFVHIAASVINEAIAKRTPAGFLSSELRADLFGHNGAAAQDMAQARMIVGTVLATGFGFMAANGYVSGSGPTDRNKAAMWRLAGNQPHSVRIGDVWYSMNRLGPLGMLLGMSADLYDVGKTASQGDMLAAAAGLHHAIVQNVLDESFMRGPAELLQAIEDPGRYGERYIQNFASSFVPYSVGMAQLARASDPYTRQARTVMDSIRQKVPGMSESLFPRRDVWGQPIPSRDALIAAGATAIYEQRMSQDPVNISLANMGIGIAPVDRTIRNVKLTDEQYDDFARIAGRMAKQRLDVFVRSPDWQQWPAGVRADAVKVIVEQSREAARGMMFMKFPSILSQATQQKMQRHGVSQ